MNRSDEAPRVPLDAVLRAFQNSVERARRAVSRTARLEKVHEMDIPVFGVNSIEVELPVQLYVGPESEADAKSSSIGAFAMFDGPAEQRGVIRFRVEALPQYADQEEVAQIAELDEAQYTRARKRRTAPRRERES
ncbi:MAG: hypothetical protein ABI779_06995 [Acidobacteriota bacterium]